MKRKILSIVLIFSMIINMTSQVFATNNINNENNKEDNITNELVLEETENNDGSEEETTEIFDDVDLENTRFIPEEYYDYLEESEKEEEQEEKKENEENEENEENDETIKNELDQETDKETDKDLEPEIEQETEQETIDKEENIDETNNEQTSEEQINKEQTKEEKEETKETKEEVVEEVVLIEDTIASISEIREQEFVFDDLDNIATISEIQNELLGECSNIVKKDGVIDITDNVELNQTLYITEDTTLNLNNFTITIATNSEVILVKNAELTITSNDGNIIGCDGYSVIKADNATLNLENVTIKAGIKAKAIEVRNTNINTDGAKIYGGTGEDFLDKKGGDGEVAIYANQNKNNLITLNNTFVKGGQGGSGNDSTSRAMAGSGLQLNIVVFPVTSNETIFYSGYAGEAGGGDGAEAIFIETEQEEYLKIEDSKICGGDGGKAIATTKMLLLGSLYDLDEPEDTKYDLREEGVITSPKDQGSTSSCWAHSYVGSAEAGILKSDRAYAESLIDEGDTELDFSEIHMMYYYNNPQEDPLGNAGYSQNEYENVGGSFPIAALGANISSVNIYAARHLAPARDKYYLDKVPEGAGIFTGSSSNEVINKIKPAILGLVENDENKYNIDVMQKESRIVSRSEFEEGTEGDILFHKSMKKYIKEYGSVQMGMSWDVQKSHYTDGIDKDYSVWSNVGSTNDGHAIQVVGWDDNYSKDNFATITRDGVEYKVQSNGALLIKNSWGAKYNSGFFWLSYEHTVNPNFQYIAHVFTKKPKNENLYYYDSANCDMMLKKLRIQKYANVFRIKKDQEKLNYVTIYHSEGRDSYTGKLVIAKVIDAEEGDKPGIDSDGNFTINIMSKSRQILSTINNVTLYPGNNYIELPEVSKINVNKGDVIYVGFEDIDRECQVSLSMPKSTAYNNGYLHYRATIIQNVSFIQQTADSWLSLNSLGNLRIKLATEYNPYTVKYSKTAPLNATKTISSVDIEDSEGSYGDDGTVNLKLTGKTYLLEGWEQIGWSKNENSTTKDFDIGGTYTANQLGVTAPYQEITLYPVWKANNYKIKFEIDSKYSTVTIDDLDAEYDSDVTLPTFVDTSMIGAKFDKWVFNNNEYENGASLTKPNFTSTKDEVVIFRAKFVETENLFYVRFHKQKPATAINDIVGDNIATLSVTLRKQNVILPTDKWTLEGYNLVGWSIEPNNSEVFNINNISSEAFVEKYNTNFVDEMVFNVYSVWQPNKYKIKFNVDSRNSNTTYNEIEATYDSNVTLANFVDNDMMGATFDKWVYNNVEYSNGATLTKPNLTAENNGIVTMNAKFNNYKFNIRFNVATPSDVGGELTTTDIPNITNITYVTDNISIPTTTFGLTGYEFKGWSDTPNGTLRVTAGQNINSHTFVSYYNLNKSTFTNNMVLDIYSKFELPTKNNNNGYVRPPGGGGPGGSGGGAAIPQTNNNDTQVQAVSNEYDGPATNNSMTVVENGQIIANIDGSISYITNEGVLLSGWQKINMSGNTNYYFFTEDNKMYSGWMKDASGNIYHLGLDGSLSTSNINIADKTYNIGANGLVSGATIEDLKLSGEPIMEVYTGEWIKTPDDTGWSYFTKTSEGQIKNIFANGIYQIKNQQTGKDDCYMFDLTGRMLKGIQFVNGKFLYFEIGGTDEGKLKSEIIFGLDGSMIEVEPTNIFTIHYQKMGYVQ